jgi:hypothetical protein
MEKINNLYEHAYSPQMQKVSKKSLNSKSHILLDRLRMKNNYSDQDRPHDSGLPTIPSKYQRIIKEASYPQKAGGTLNQSYARAASFARVRNRSTYERAVDDNSSSMSMHSSKRMHSEYA